MKRLSFLIPRTVILLLLITAVWLAKDSILRFGIIRYGQRLINAKVEMGQLQTNFKQQRIFLKGLKIADPRNAMSNLLQSDIAYFKLDPTELLNRRFVVTEGQINGLMVNAPRTESGSINSQPYGTDLESARRTSPTIKTPLSKLGTERISQLWLNQIDPGVRHSLSEFDSEALAQEIQNGWSTRINNYRERVEELEPRLRRLNQTFLGDRKFANPLRDRQLYENSLSEIQSLQSQAAELRQQADSDLVQLAGEVSRIEQAVKRDQGQIQQRQPTNQFDESLVSELLLHQEGEELVAEIVSWLIWFREAIPDSNVPKSQQPVIGTDIRFANITPSPDFVIKQIEVEGNGWFARQHLNFVGTAYNVTTQPELLSEPTRIDLRALGKSNVLINGTIDRTAGNQIDNLRIQFPDLEFPSRQLGHEQSMLVAFGGNRRANSDITLEINGNQVSGEVKLRYSQVSLHVDSLSETLGGNEIRLRINQGLNQVSQFNMTLIIEGSLDSYTIKLKSDLGTQFANVVNSAVVERVEQQNQKLIRELNQRSELLTKLVKSEYEPALQGLLSQIGKDIHHIAELKGTVESNSESGWRKLR